MNPEHLVLVAVVGGAAVVPFLSRRFRVPAAALEIVFGMALFHTVLHEQPEWFLFLKEIGFIYLMFVAGMELDLRSLARSPRLRWYALIPILALVAAPLAFAAVGFAPYLGLAIAMVSAGIVIPVLKETQRIRTPLGRDIVGTALVGEILSIAVLTAVDTYHSHGLSLTAAWMVFKLVALLLLATLVLKALYVASWWNQRWVEKVMQSEDPSEEGIRGVIVLAFAGALLAEWAGVEPILGSFMAGLMTSYVFRNKERFEDKVNAVGFGFFTPFFFIGIGADVDLALFHSPTVVLLAGGMTLAVLLSKAPALLCARPMGLRRRDAAAMALLLSAPLSMIVVAGALGQRMGLLDTAQVGALVIAALVSSVLFPYLFRTVVGSPARS